MKTARIVLVLIVFVSACAGLIAFDFYVWRLKHPTAPVWTYAF
jgi:hypothetical protein